jgi:hypothetical protein
MSRNSSGPFKETAVGLLLDVGATGYQTINRRPANSDDAGHAGRRLAWIAVSRSGQFNQAADSFWALPRRHPASPPAGFRACRHQAFEPPVRSPTRFHTFLPASEVLSVHEAVLRWLQTLC